ncbi:MAG: hypothetical protein LM593_02330 [Candidatus Verstraetearchaeota archaeon]|jgi:hypothetical protein|nr:hypothetical protein [Candidatus Verstraetearchaeota archaeon]
MAPPLFTRLYINGQVLYEKVKEIAKNQNYEITYEDSINKILHIHKKAHGRTIHLIIYIGDGKDRSLAIDVKPGYEGLSMDYGRRFLEEIKKVAR